MLLVWNSIKALTSIAFSRLKTHRRLADGTRCDQGELTTKRRQGAPKGGEGEEATQELLWTRTHLDATAATATRAPARRNGVPCKGTNTRYAQWKDEAR